MGKWKDFQRALINKVASNMFTLTLEGSDTHSWMCGEHILTIYYTIVTYTNPYSKMFPWKLFHLLYIIWLLQQSITDLVAWYNQICYFKVL